ncbi:hypothetical protein BDB00DRAFT_869014 [Zychaea mexicana]|uniref:uncharacterized protein n=1 Tax=Zychaea mexicana TaxID=64656 RepID=UPI0022FF08CF|nr:uncharacterized protein BDB00DRAFT_869014 [Zychaea mexicana]KAI9496788.1 hypothetical protein BDB00DRAFT_869014 [Zychaea mexicana]
MTYELALKNGAQTFKNSTYTHATTTIATPLTIGKYDLINDHTSRTIASFRHFGAAIPRDISLELLFQPQQSQDSQVLTPVLATAFVTRTSRIMNNNNNNNRNGIQNNIKSCSISNSIASASINSIILALRLMLSLAPPLRLYFLQAGTKSNSVNRPNQQHKRIIGGFDQAKLTNDSLQ